MEYLQPSRPDGARPGGRVGTTLVRIGRDPGAFGGLVNTPICRGSTILARSLEEWESRKTPDNPMASYGRFGTATTRSFEASMAELEGGHAAIVYPSGLAACTGALMAVCRPGDHVLMTDSIYGPTRAFAVRVLARMGIETEFFAPDLGGGIRALLRPDTRAVFLESPGSMTFEVQDVSAIAQEARRVDALVLMDNTWATPLFFQPLRHGVDISIQSATKYIIGHSDALLGVVTANARAWPLVREGAHDFGQTAGPDDINLALRGLRSLSVRLQQHQASALHLAGALQRHALVRQVLHPALPGHPQHALWARDFRGASGLFAIELQPAAERLLPAIFSRLQLFGIGLSWGGYESLALPAGRPVRSTPCDVRGPLVRLHVGLEDPHDLLEDLTQALDFAATER